MFKCNLSIGAFLIIYFSNLTFSYDAVRQVPILLSLDSIGDADVLLGQMPCLLRHLCTVKTLIKSRENGAV